MVRKSEGVCGLFLTMFPKRDILPPPITQADSRARVAGKMSWSSVMVQMTSVVDLFHLRGQNGRNLDNIMSRLSGPHSLFNPCIQQTCREVIHQVLRINR